MLKEFKNGNLHINIRDEEASPSIIETIYNCFDLLPVNDIYNIGNDCIAIDFSYNGGYNYYSITTYDFKKLKDNKTIILYPLDNQYINKNIL